MPAFCQRCGELADGDACAKCGEKTVAGATAKWASVGAVPSAFTAAARVQSMGAALAAVERPRKEKATALFNFVPQDSATQLRLTKGEEVEVVRKDPDGWWFVVKDGEKGLVPGSYVRIDKPFVAVPDAAILAAREASNQRFLELSRPSDANGDGDAAHDVEYASPLGLEGHGDAPPAPVLPRARNSPVRADVRAGDGHGEKPQNVRKLRKCFACKETILGRTKTAKDQIFHEICLLCKGCREPIGEDEDYILIKKKAYHADCGRDVAHCWVCDKEILGRVYKAGDGSFHRLCMICSVCKKQADEAGSKLENDELVCGSCVQERERKAREEREAKERAAREKAEREAAEAAARALAEKKAREAEEAARAKMEAEARAKAEAESVARAKAEAEAAAARAREEEAAREKAEAEAAVAAAKANASGYDSQRSSTAGLDEFDLEATPMGLSGHERMSEVSDFGSVLDSDYGYSNSNTGRDSMRLSEVLDMESIDAFNNGQNNRLSDISGLSIDSTQPKGRPRRSTLQEDREEYLSDEDEDRELCGGCGLVLEGEAVGALNQYFHYQCFKCSHCRRVIAEDDGYAEKDNMAFHQACYQTRFGKKCCRCTQVLKGKVVKALDNLYHPDCFVCFKCSSSLSESFFEHEGQAVCAKCKHEAIAYAQPPAPVVAAPIGVGVAGYRFDAQDETQLTIYPGDKVSILQKDDDGWWLVDFNKKRGYVPGSYLIEEPPARPKPAAAAPVPGLCSECATQNPAVARFCRSCGNNLQA